MRSAGELTNSPITLSLCQHCSIKMKFIIALIYMIFASVNCDFTSHSFEHHTFHTVTTEGGESEVRIDRQHIDTVNSFLNRDNLESKIDRICGHLTTMNTDECKLCVTNVHQFDLTEATHEILSTTPAPYSDMSAFYYSRVYSTIPTDVSRADDVTTKPRSVCLAGNEMNSETLVSVVLSLDRHQDVNTNVMLFTTASADTDDTFNTLSDTISRIEELTEVIISIIQTSLADYISSNQHQSSFLHCDVLHVRGNTFDWSGTLQALALVHERDTTLPNSGVFEGSMYVIWERSDWSDPDPGTETQRGTVQQEQQQRVYHMEWDAVGHWYVGEVKQVVPGKSTYMVNVYGADHPSTVAAAQQQSAAAGTQDENRVYCGSLFHTHSIAVDRPLAVHIGTVTFLPRDQRQQQQRQQQQQQRGHSVNGDNSMLSGVRSDENLNSFSGGITTDQSNSLPGAAADSAAFYANADVTHYNNSYSIKVEEKIVQRMIDSGDFAFRRFDSDTQDNDEYTTSSNNNSSNSSNNNRSSGNEKVLLIVTFPYNGEPVTELHLEYLFNTVDCFIITEARYTFTGRRKDVLYIEQYADMFTPYLSKIRFIVIDSFPEINTEDFLLRHHFRYANESTAADWINCSDNERESLVQQALAKWDQPISQVKEGPDFVITTWYHEHYQRDLSADYIIEQFSGRRYVVIVVDSDEIVSRETASGLRGLHSMLDTAPLFLEMKMFYYNFQWMKKLQWYFPFVLNEKTIHQHTFSTIRTYVYERKFIAPGGWHASWFSSIPKIIEKLTSFGHTEMNQPQYKDPVRIQQCIADGIDLFDRQGGDEMSEYDVTQLPVEFQMFQKRFVKQHQQHQQQQHRRKPVYRTAHTVGFRESELNSTGGAADTAAPAAESAVHIVVTFNDNFFIETAYGLRKALTTLGYRNVHVMGDVNLTTIRQIKALSRDTNTDRDTRAVKVVQIALGPHRRALLLPIYIVFHTENPWEAYIHLERYKHVVSRAAAMLVYSTTQVSFMQSLCGGAVPVFVVPMYSDSVYHSAVHVTGVGGTTKDVVDNGNRIEYIRKDTDSQSPATSSGSGGNDDNVRACSMDDDVIGSNIDSQSNDIALFLSFSDRRFPLIVGLQRNADRDGITMLHQQLVDRSEVDFFDTSTKEFLALHSKVVVNFHQSDNAVLETHRINHLLSLGKCIISERSTADPELDAQYEGAIVFADTSDWSFYSSVQEYVRDDAKRHAQELKALNKYKSIMSDVDELGKAVVAALRKHHHRVD